MKKKGGRKNFPSSMLGWKIYEDKEVSPFFIQLKFLTNYTKFDHQNMIFIEELERMLVNRRTFYDNNNSG